MHKETGQDQQSQQDFFQDFATELAPIMIKLFKLQLDTGKKPDVWREAFDVPVFKKVLRATDSFKLQTSRS